MSRHATLDPALIKPTSNKRKVPSLVAPPAVKKKRTSKKLHIHIGTLFVLIIMPFFILIIFIFA
jgi:hypothetical protein